MPDFFAPDMRRCYISSEEIWREITAYAFKLAMFRKFESIKLKHFLQGGRVATQFDVKGGHTVTTSTTSTVKYIFCFRASRRNCAIARSSRVHE
jgi:hypothetical protein